MLDRTDLWLLFDESDLDPNTMAPIIGTKETIEEAFHDLTVESNDEVIEMYMVDLSTAKFYLAKKQVVQTHEINILE